MAPTAQERATVTLGCIPTAQVIYRTQKSNTPFTRYSRLSIWQPVWQQVVSCKRGLRNCAHATCYSFVFRVECLTRVSSNCFACIFVNWFKCFDWSLTLLRLNGCRVSVNDVEKEDWRIAVVSAHITYDARPACLTTSAVAVYDLVAITLTWLGKLY